MRGSDISVMLWGHLAGMVRVRVKTLIEEISFRKNSVHPLNTVPKTREPTQMSTEPELAALCSPLFDTLFCFYF